MRIYTLLGRILLNFALIVSFAGIGCMIGCFVADNPNTSGLLFLAAGACTSAAGILVIAYDKVSN